ncbi:ABC transporter ATP-binding protein [bacterium]|nr:MAG: ABC transporter ATP-binding protein [bacterium]
MHQASRTLIQADHISKTYGRGTNAFTALSEVSLGVHEGETIAIVGKSGSGKSTLMHILALLDSPTAGVLSVNGKLASDMSSRDLARLRNQTFGFVFQQFFLNASSSVLDNVMLPLKIAGMGRRQRKQRALEVLEQVDLADKAKANAGDLSGGQKQRVVIARALVNDPKIIFADEPTGNLDSATGQLVENLLFRLNSERGITLVIVTHDADLARRCNRQVFIKDGQIATPVRRVTI